MLTPEGVTRIWEVLAGVSKDSLKNAKVVVGDGKTLASAKLDGPPAIDGTTITFTATFGEKVANFEWSTRSVVTAQGVVLDTDEADNGRKAAGQVWTIDVVLELA